MLKKQNIHLILAFLLGVLLTLLLASNSNNGRYVPYGDRGTILDTRNGRVHTNSNRGGVWVVRVEKVGVKKR